MTHIRRSYAYLLAFAGLAILCLAAANLLQLLVDVLLRASAAANESAVRDAVSRDAAALLVGLPVWLLHWGWIDRAAHRDAAERRNSLRQAFLYVILAAAMLIATGAAGDGLRAAFDALLGNPREDSTADAIVRPLPFALIALGVWLAHWRVASSDRRNVGEDGRSATIRRWYVYGGAFVALVALTANAHVVSETLWRLLTGPGQPAGAGLSVPAAGALVALAAWVLHWARLPARVRNQPGASADDAATLRWVYLFLGVALGVIGALLGASQLLFYAVARALGVDRPAGVGGDLLQAAAGPASLTLTYGVTWLYHRAAVRRQASAAAAETPRQAGVRRLYVHLVALAALGVWASGAAGLLWSLGDALSGVAAVGADNADGLREQVALFATLVLVGLPVWLRSWRPRPSLAADAHSLSRRLYVYLSLIGATLALVGGAGAALYRLLGLALGEPFSAQVRTDLAHALGIAIVAGLLAAYHWRTLRADGSRPIVASRPDAGADVVGAPPAPLVVEIRAADAASLSTALAALRSTGVQVTELGTSGQR